MTMDIVVRKVSRYGYLPIVTVDGKEVYRGEFRHSAQLAFEWACGAADRLNVTAPLEVSIFDKEDLTP